MNEKELGRDYVDEFFGTSGQTFYKMQLDVGSEPTLILARHMHYHTAVHLDAE